MVCDINLFCFRWQELHPSLKRKQHKVEAEAKAPPKAPQARSQTRRRSLQKKGPPRPQRNRLMEWVQQQWPMLTIFATMQLIFWPHEDLGWQAQARRKREKERRKRSKLLIYQNISYNKQRWQETNLGIDERYYNFSAVLDKEWKQDFIEYLMVEIREISRKQHVFWSSLFPEQLTREDNKL